MSRAVFGGAAPFPFEGMTKRPMGLPLMLSAWQGLVAYAATQPDILQRFIDETGCQLPTSTLDRMIGRACGEDAATFAAFCDFVTVNLWGEEEADQPATGGDR